jgi:hypothetical protein
MAYGWALLSRPLAAQIESEAIGASLLFGLATFLFPPPTVETTASLHLFGRVRMSNARMMRRHWASLVGRNMGPATYDKLRHQWVYQELVGRRE